MENKSNKQDRYIRLDPDIDRSKLVRYDLYKRVKLKGDDYFVLFHRKGTPLGPELPAGLYVRSEELDDILRSAPASKFSRKLRPTGKIAAMLITSQFEEKILNNPQLDLEEKIELTVHCASQALLSMFEHGRLTAESLELIGTAAGSLASFIELMFIEHDGISSLLDKLLGYDYLTYRHSVHTSLYAGILSHKLSQNGLYKSEPEGLRDIYFGALLHDVGKLCIDHALLNKKKPLTDEEFEEIKKHPEYGIELVREFSLPEAALSIIHHHHENWDGNGYPDRLSYQQISAPARIAAICEVFDALTTRQPYRDALKPFEALILMKKQMAGKFYHPYLDTLIQFLGRDVR